MKAEAFLDAPDPPAAVAAAFLDAPDDAATKPSAAAFLDAADPTQAAPSPLAQAPTPPATLPSPPVAPAPPAAPPVLHIPITIPRAAPVVDNAPITLVPPAPAPAVSQETPTETPTSLLGQIAWRLNPRSLADPKRLVAPAPPPPVVRLPDKVLEDLRAGRRDLSEQEFGTLLAWLDHGNFDHPAQVVDTLAASGAVTPQGLAMARDAATVGQVLKTERPGILPGAVSAGMNAFVRAVSMNTVSPTAPAPEGDPTWFTRLKQVSAERAAEAHPGAALAGDLAGVALPYTAGVKVLRALRVARGLAEVGPGLQGALTEGAKVGGLQSVLTRPEGSEAMTTADALTARALQGGIGVAAGAVLDFLGYAGHGALHEVAGPFLNALRDKRFARALTQEAQAKGFKTVDEYLGALVELRRTPSGTVVVPRNQVLAQLPGEPAVAAPRPMTPNAPAGVMPSAPRAEPPPAPAPDFPSEAALRVQAHREKARGLGLTDAQAQAFAPEDRTDPLTQFQGRRDRDPTLARAIQAVDKTDQPGAYVAMDLANLAGLNARFGEPGANRVFKDVAGLVRGELDQVPGTVHLFRHGGDEMSAVIVGSDEAAVQAALTRARAKVNDYVVRQGLDQIPHTKIGKGPGTGVHFATAPIGRGSTVDDVLELAHRRLEDAKGSFDVNAELSAPLRARGPDEQTAGTQGVRAAPARGGGGEGAGPGGAGDSRAAELADYERLAAQATDPNVRTLLRRQADLLRGELRGEPLPRTPQERYEAHRRLDPARDDLLTAIRKLGGIDTATETDWAGRLKHLGRTGFGLPALERPGKGRTLDDLAEALHERGYLMQRDVGELYDKLDRAAAGETVHSFYARPETTMPPRADSTDADWHYAEPGAPVADRDFVVDTDAGTVIPSRPFTHDDWLRLEKEEADANAWFQREGGSEPDRAGGGNELHGDGSAGVPERLAHPLPGRAGDQPRPGETGTFPGIEPVDRTRQAVADRERDVAARLSGPDVRAHAGEGDLFAGPRPTQFKIEEPLRETRVPIQRDVFEWLGVPEGKVFADYEALYQKHPEQFRSPEDVREHVEFVLAHPQISMPASHEGYTLLVRSNERDRAVVTEFELRGGKYRVRSAYVLEEGQLNEKLGAALRRWGGAPRVLVRTDELSVSEARHLPTSRGVDQPKRESTLLPNAGTDKIEHVPTGALATGITRVTAANDVAHLVAPLRKHAQENFLAVVTDGEGNILRVSRLFKGAEHQAGVDPGTAAGAVASTIGAKRAWFVHNHPTGDPALSEPDRVITDKLAELLRGSGVDVEGMVVVAPGGTWSMYQPHGPFAGTAKIPAAVRTESIPVTERQLRGRPVQGEEIRKPEELTAAFDGREGVLAIDAAHRVIGFEPMTGAELRQMRSGSDGASRRLMALFDRSNAAAFAVRIAATGDEARAIAGNLAGFARQTGRPLFDVLDGNDRSLAKHLEIPDQSTFYANPFTLALADVAKDVGLNPGRNLAAAFAGGVAGATNSEGEPGSARWWLDVAAGAGAGVTLGQFMRRTNLLGKGSIVDNARVRLGEWINHLPLIGQGPAELQALKHKQRLMRQLVDRQTEAVGRELLRQFTPSERAMMADLIETRGIVKDLNLVHRQAQALDDYLTFAGERMKALKMLPEDLELGGYLHRYYAKHLNLDTAFRTAKRQSLSGSYSIARGTDDKFPRQYFSPGARAVVDELEQVTHEIDKLSRKGGDLLAGDTAGRLADLKARQRELGQVELREFVGRQDGKLRSFLFATDEVGHVDTGIEPILADRLRGRPGDVTTPRASGVEDLHPTDHAWRVRGVGKDDVLLHRDWTKAERKTWGEIDDAGYRYVRGMAEVSHDVSLATLFDTVARNTDWTSASARVTPKGKPWVFVPTTRVHKNSPLQRYGALAGQYVRPDVWAGIQGYGRAPFAPGPIGDLYRHLLSKWKLYHTVYNPVTHANNTWSNAEMFYQGGYGPTDLARGIGMVVRNEGDELWREARDAGLFGEDWTSTLLRGGEKGGGSVLHDLARALREQPEIPDAALATRVLVDIKEWWINSRHAIGSAGTPWQTGAELARAMAAPFMTGVKFAWKPVRVATQSAQRLYRFEDNIFKAGVYAAERAKGASPAEAVTAANNLFFDYQEVPLAIKMLRDFPVGSPFITYTYKAIPAIARNIAQNPERVLALVAAYEGFNYAAMVSSDEGLSPGQYWQIESAEDDASAPWDRGRALWGARNLVRLPFPEGYRLALGRAHALGNPFMTDAGGRQKLPAVPGLASFWGSSLFGSNPLHALLDAAVNEDWKGKAIYAPGAPAEEKAKAIAGYLYQAWAPTNPLIPGSYQQSRILEGLANDARRARAAGKDPGVIGPVVDAANATAQALGFSQFTGLNRAGQEILTRDAMLAAFGIKLRPVQFELTQDFEFQAIERKIDQTDKWFGQQMDKAADGRLSDPQVDKIEKQYDKKLDRYYEEMDQRDKVEQTLERARRWK